MGFYLSALGFYPRASTPNRTGTNRLRNGCAAIITIEAKYYRARRRQISTAVTNMLPSTRLHDADAGVPFHQTCTHGMPLTIASFDAYVLPAF